MPQENYAQPIDLILATEYQCWEKNAILSFSNRISMLRKECCTVCISCSKRIYAEKYLIATEYQCWGKSGMISVYLVATEYQCWEKNAMISVYLVSTEYQCWENSAIMSVYLVATEYQCPEENGVFPNPENCSIYYTCRDGMAKLSYCPHGMGYDTISGTCLESFQLKNCMTDDKLYDTGT